MSKIDFEYLDEQYDGYAPREAIRGNTNPQGSLTDNLRMVKVNRDGARKRLRAIKEAGR